MLGMSEGGWIEVGKRSYLWVSFSWGGFRFWLCLSRFVETALVAMFTRLLAPFLECEPSAFFIS